MNMTELVTCVWFDHGDFPGGKKGSVYGRHMYEIMSYWDDDHPEWAAEEQAFAAAWRKQPKSVVSRSLKSVGPNLAQSLFRRTPVAASPCSYRSDWRGCDPVDLRSCLSSRLTGWRSPRFGDFDDD
jgi:hypothetical protein